MAEFDDLRMDLIQLDTKNIIARFAADMRDRIPPGMSVRELTQNGIEAYTRNDLTGEVVWAIEEVEGGQRWCMYDTGPGMSPQEVRGFIGRIGGCGGTIGTSDNHGIGGKQAGLRDHPGGVAWITLKDDEVTEALLRVGPGTDRPEFGCRSGPVQDGEDALPLAVVQAQHGTVVRFPNDTPEPNVSPTPDRLVKLLAERYWNIPAGVVLKVEFRKTDGSRSQWRVPALSQALTHHAELDASVTLRDGTVVRALVLHERPQTNRAEQGPGAVSRVGIYTDDGRAIARNIVVHQGECYINNTQGASNRVRNFGFTYQPHRVQLVLFPPDGHYQATDTRNGLEPNPNVLPGQHGLPWAEWAEEFRQLLRTSEELEMLRRWQESLEVGDEEDDRLLLLEVLLLLSPVRQLVATQQRGSRSPGRPLLGGGTSPTNSAEGDGQPPGGEGAGGGGGSSGASRGSLNRGTDVGQAEGQLRARLSRVMPDVRWLPIEERNDDLFGHAGGYIPGDNRIILNSAWTEFDRWRGDIAREAEERDDSIVIESLVRLAAQAIAIDAYFAACNLQRTLDTERLEQALLAPLSRQVVLREMRRLRQERRSRRGPQPTAEPAESALT